MKIEQMIGSLVIIIIIGFTLSVLNIQASNRQKKTFHSSNIQQGVNLVAKFEVIFDKIKKNAKKIQIKYEVCDKKLQLELIKITDKATGTNSKKWQNVLLIN